MNTIHIILSIFCLHDLAISYDPILYAVGDGNGHIILLKKLTSRCRYYRSIYSRLGLVLRFYSGQWEITKGATVSVSNDGCSQDIGTGTQLFTHEGEDLRNGSWVNVQTNTSATNFSIYSFEDCTTYEGAFLDGDFKTGEKVMDSSHCQKKAENTETLLTPEDDVNVNLFTTLTDNVFEDDVVNQIQILCRFRNVEMLTWAFVKLNQTDENASIIVRGNSCSGGVTGRSAKIVNINVALLSSHASHRAYSDLKTRSPFETSNVDENET